MHTHAEYKVEKVSGSSVKDWLPWCGCIIRRELKFSVIVWPLTSDVAPLRGNIEKGMKTVSPAIGAPEETCGKSRPQASTVGQRKSNSNYKEVIVVLVCL